MNKINFYSEVINISSSELGSQIEFAESNDDDGKYFLIQKFYGDYDDESNSYYIESNISEITGHYNNVLKIISNNFIEFKTNRFNIKINFEISELKFKKLNKVINYIIK